MPTSISGIVAEDRLKTSTLGDYAKKWGEERKQQKGMHIMKEADMLAAKIDLLLSRLNERAHEKEAMKATIQATD